MTLRDKDIGIVAHGKTSGQYSMIGFADRLREISSREFATSFHVARLPLTSLLPRQANRKVKSFIRMVDEALLQRLLQSRPRCALVHVTDIGLIALARHNERQRSIVTVHDTIPARIGAGRLRGPRLSWRARQRLVYFREQLKKFDAIHSPSYQTANDIVEFYGVSENKIAIIPPPLFQFIQKSSEAGEREAYEADILRIVHIGAETYKNRGEVFRVAHALGQRGWRVELRLFGRTRDADKSAAQDVQGVHSISVREFEAVDKIEMMRLIKTSDVVIVPSYYEGFGYPVIEAQSLGVPVVCAATGALPETAGKDAVMLEPTDTNGFAQQIESIKTSAVIRDELIKMGDINMRRFNQLELERQYRMLYSNLLFD